MGRMTLPIDFEMCWRLWRLWRLWGEAVGHAEKLLLRDNASQDLLTIYSSIGRGKNYSTTVDEMI